jgi:hypothetical protein
LVLITQEHLKDVNAMGICKKNYVNVNIVRKLEKKFKGTKNKAAGRSPKKKQKVAG